VKKGWEPLLYGDQSSVIRVSCIYRAGIILKLVVNFICGIL